MKHPGIPLAQLTRLVL